MVALQHLHPYHRFARTSRDPEKETNLTSSARLMPAALGLRQSPRGIEVAFAATVYA